MSVTFTHYPARPKLAVRSVQYLTLEYDPNPTEVAALPDVFRDAVKGLMSYTRGSWEDAWHCADCGGDETQVAYVHDEDGDLEWAPVIVIVENDTIRYVCLECGEHPEPPTADEVALGQRQRAAGCKW